MLDQSAPALKHAVDTLSGAAIAASLMGYLSPLAAALGAIWYIVQIYGWFEKRVIKRRGYRRRADDQ